MFAQLPPESSVVVIRLRSLGDTVLITPALQLLKRARPDLSVSVVLDRAFAPLLEDWPEIARVVRVERGRTIAAIQAIRSERPTLCLNLHGGVSSAWMTLFSGASYRAGYAHYGMRFVYNVRIPRAQRILGRPADAPVHTAEHHASAVFHFGLEPTEIPSASLYAPSSGRTKPYAVVHVAAAYETKRWPADRFLSVAQMLRDQYGLQPVVIAGPGSDHLLGGFQELECRRGLSIPELKSLIGGAKLFVGADSGPAHIAAALDVPSVVLFGSSDSRVWGPWKARAEVVETAWDCKPCPGDRCYAFDEPRCILSIEREAVERAIERVLSE